MGEPQETIDHLIDRWIVSAPHGHDALMQDPQFSYQVEWIRCMLVRLDGVLESEGLLTRHRHRIFEKMIMSGPDPIEAMKRIAAFRIKVDDLMAQPAPRLRWDPWCDGR